MYHTTQPSRSTATSPKKLAPPSAYGETLRDELGSCTTLGRAGLEAS